MKLCIENTSFGVLFEPGCGKTLTLCSVLDSLTNNGATQHPSTIPNTLIVAPVVVCDHWRREFTQHFPELAKYTQVLLGTSVQKQRAATRNRDARIWITNHETFERKAYVKLMSLVGVPEVLIVDESHRFKNPEARRTKAMIVLADLAKRRYILTGSLILQSPADIWAQFRILSPAIFTKNFYAFRRQYFYDANERVRASTSRVTWSNWQPRPDMQPELSAIIQKHTIRRTKEECLDLPPLVRQTIAVPPTDQQARLYEQMRKHYVATTDEQQTVAADLAITRTLRLQQICSGILRATDDTTSTIDSSKLAALRELISDLAETPHKLILWTCWRDTYVPLYQAATYFELNPVMLTGDQDAKEKTQAVNRFSDDPTCRVIIANQAAAGLGVNLQAASYAIYFAKSFNLEHDLQSEARCHRAGSERHQKITRIDLITSGTIEEDITHALRHKLSAAELLYSLNKRLGVTSGTSIAA